MITEPVTIIADGGGFRCSACGGFVRQDAQFCKHCHSSFGPGDPATSPSLGRVLLTLLVAGLMVGLFIMGGVALGDILWPRTGFEMFGSPGMWRGGLIGFVLGSISALLTMIVGLRSK